MMQACAATDGMALPDIDFYTIRLHNSDQANAFEELCCQIAGEETFALARTGFSRKGRGGDGGVECYAILSDGSEIGWQVKFYSDVANALKSLTGSLKKALEKHPRMDRFIACLPFDLSDSRKADVVTAAQRWDEWKADQIAAATLKGRTITIDRWDSFELKNRLTSARPAAAGRILFWFNRTLFTPEWFSSRFERVRDSLKQRYVPETHVDLPVRKSVLATLHDPSLFEELEALNALVEERWRATPMDCTASETAVQAVQQAFAAAVAARGKPEIPIEPARQAIAEARDAVSNWHRRVREADGAGEGPSPHLTAVSNFLSQLQTVDLALRSPHWRHLNTRALLVLGDAGSGKSHLLADACAHQLRNGAPAIMVLGGKLPDEEPWSAILRDLDLTNSLQVQHFLSALNAAGEAAGGRMLIAIDALNEKNGQRIWPDRLAGLLYDARQYDWISIVLSCRSTYEDVVIPSDLDETALPRVTHAGFSVGEAQQYLRKRGVSLSEAPNQVEEFRNPLFLKICCDALQLRGDAFLPGGLGSVTRVFGLYAEAVADKVHATLKAVKGRQFAQRGLAALAIEMGTTGRGEIALSRANAIIDPIYPGGAVGADLLFELQAEGMLTEEPADDISPEPTVRFTFERMSDHAIAAELLARGVVGAAKAAAIVTGGPLDQALSQSRSRIRQGLLDALAVQLPERFGIELPEFAGVPASRYVATALTKSLLSRRADALTDETWRLAETLGGAALRYETLIAIATDPGHVYNADYLDRLLRPIAMPERDGVWSVHIAQPRHEQAQNLIDWTRQADPARIDPARADLTGVALCWLLTTSSRTIRDTATKALVTLLADRPELALILWDRFHSVDDAYLTERLVAALYGAALQGRWTQTGFTRLAERLYADVFETGEPPLNILLRDHAERLMRFAEVSGVISGKIDTARTQGPYVSPWPIEYVSDETIAGYTRTYNGGEAFRDEIVGSCFDGDFARYQLDYAVEGWSAGLRNAGPVPTRSELAAAWLARFTSAASAPALAAYDAMRAALAAPAGATRSEQRALGAAEKAAFRDAVGEQAYAEWQAEAANWRETGMYQHTMPRNDLAQFNLNWARRWVCKRAHDLGWSEDLHGVFDLSVRNDRQTHARERIGKKYQWLALYELCARMDDNLEPLPDHAGDSALERLRNIDPSMLRSVTGDNGWGRFETEVFWIAQKPDLSELPVEETLAWLASDIDLFDDVETLDVKDPEDEGWLVLQGFETWRTDGDGPSRETWRRIGCFVVDRADVGPVLTRLQHHHLQGGGDVPSGRLGAYNSLYLGEHPWALSGGGSFRDIDRAPIRMPWVADGPNPSLEVLPTTVEYLSESTGHDASIDENINLVLPAAWLMEEMGLRFAGGEAIAYVDAEGSVCFQDPSVSMEGRSAGLIRRKDFLEFLKANDLAAIWAVAGEKSVYGSTYSDGFGGRRTFTRLFVSTDDAIVVQDRYDTFEEPDAEQLAALIGEDAEETDGDGDGDGDGNTDIDLSA